MVHPIRDSETEPAARPGGQALLGGRVPAGRRVVPATRALLGTRLLPARRVLPGRRVLRGERVSPGRQPPAGGRAGQAGILLTGRGAVTGMIVLFFLSLLLSAWLGWGWVAGAAFVAGSGAAARYTHRRDLLTVAVTPPLLFLCALLPARLLTAGSSHVLVSAAAGSLLTLAGTAPWLLAGVALNLLIAVARGLPGCIRDLRRDLRGAQAGPRLTAARAGRE